MNISVTDLETGVIENSLAITYATVAKTQIGYVSASGSQAVTTPATATTDNTKGKSHNHE